MSRLGQGPTGAASNVMRAAPCTSSDVHALMQWLEQKQQKQPEALDQSLSGLGNSSGSNANSDPVAIATSAGKTGRPHCCNYGLLTQIRRTSCINCYSCSISAVPALLEATGLAAASQQLLVPEIAQAQSRSLTRDRAHLPTFSIWERNRSRTLNCLALPGCEQSKVTP